MELQRVEHNNTEIHFLKGAAEEPLIHCMIEGVPTRGDRREVINSIVASAKKEQLNRWKRFVADEINMERG